MDDKIVTLESFYDPMLAEIIRARLEANGISCFIADGNTIGANPLYNQALGGVKLKVFEHDIEKCREILAQPEEIAVDDQPIDHSVDTICPYCYSANVRYGVATQTKPSLWRTLTAFLLATYPYTQKEWHCFNCGRDFE
jgi:hypothetical protein